MPGISLVTKGMICPPRSAIKVVDFIKVRMTTKEDFRINLKEKNIGQLKVSLAPVETFKVNMVEADGGFKIRLKSKQEFKVRLKC